MKKYFYDCEFLEGTQKKKFWWGNTKHPTIDLISIGIVCEDSREYYAISKDFNLKEAWNRFDLKHEQISGDMRNHFPNGITTKVYWIRENVLMPIFFELAEREFHNIHFKDEWAYEGKVVDLEVFKSNNKWTSNFTWFKKLIKKYGKSNKQIAIEVQEFVYGFAVKGYPKENTEKIAPKDIQLYGYYSAYDHVALCWLFGKMIDLPTAFPMYTIDLKQQLDNKERLMSNSDGKVELIAEPFVAIFNSIKEFPNYPKQVNNHNSLSDAKWNFELYKFLNEQ